MESEESTSCRADERSRKEHSEQAGKKPRNELMERWRPEGTVMVPVEKRCHEVFPIDCAS
jgi:hypothetical protein